MSQRKAVAVLGVGAIAAAALVGASAANAEPSNQNVSFFTVQSAENANPSGWFSEGDDDIAGLSIGQDALDLAASTTSVGINKRVDVPFSTADEFSLDGTGTAKFSIVVADADTPYFRLTSDAAAGDAITPTTTWSNRSQSMTLAAWAATFDPTAEVVEIGARHYSGEGAGTVTDLTFEGQEYTFGLADTDQAVSDATAPLQSQIAVLTSYRAAHPGTHTDSSYATQVAAVAKAQASLSTYQAGHSHTDASWAAQVAAKNHEADLVTYYRAHTPVTVSGVLRTKHRLTASVTSYSGISTSYQWYVGGKKVKGATKVHFTLPTSAKHHSVKVVVTRSYKDSAGKKHSYVRTAHAVATSTVK